MIALLTQVMTLAWMTDLHWDESYEEGVIQEIQASQAELVLLTGDISSGKTVCQRLDVLQQKLAIPIYFILGNHDFYASSFDKVRSEVRELCDAESTLIYLHDVELVSLSKEIALLGHDAWADAYAGDYMASPTRLNDSIMIEDFVTLSKLERMQLCQELGGEAARLLHERLLLAFESHHKAILLMHAPPFQEACLYHDKIANNDWAPHFVCAAVGEMLLQVMAEYSEKQLLVLCGHTHHAAIYSPLDNLSVRVGQGGQEVRCCHLP